MKKITFTVDQILFLQKVRSTIGYADAANIDFLDDNPEPTIDVEVDLSDKSIDDIEDSIRCHINLTASDVPLAEDILELIGAMTF